MYWLLRRRRGAGIRCVRWVARLCWRHTSLLLLLLVHSGNAATLTGSYAEVPTGSTVDLTAVGPVDWVHWGLLWENTIVRKAGVPPQIGPLAIIGNQVSAFQFSDNFNGYSWSDGWPVTTATNTTTGLWAYSNRRDSGFELSLPADAATRVAKVYVGVFAGVGRFTATLSNTPSASYSDATLANFGNGPGRVYTIEYSGSPAGDTLIIQWTIEDSYDQLANVTFQAAALTSATANNPPMVSLTSPTANAAVAAGSTVTLVANAFDVDGQMQRVEFWDGGEKIGEDFGAPYELAWHNVALGAHWVTAKAIDTLGGHRTSVPVEIFAHGTGGILRGSRTFPTQLVDLTSEGTLDWAHWGYRSETDFNHKADSESQIDDVRCSETLQYSNNYAMFSWIDGTPIAKTDTTTTGIFTIGLTNFFELRVRAATTLRRLRIYTGLYAAQGNFQALLSDFSAPVYADATAVNMSGDRYDVYTLDFAAASPGQTLIIRYRSAFTFDTEFGNVTFQAATLQPLGPVLLNPSWQPGGFSFSFGTDLGKNYIVEFADALDANTWSPVSNVIGSGDIVPFTGKAKGFYRVREAGVLGP